MVNILSKGGGDNSATFEPMPCSKSPKYSNRAVTYSNRTVVVTVFPQKITMATNVFTL